MIRVGSWAAVPAPRTLSSYDVSLAVRRRGSFVPKPALLGLTLGRPSARAGPARRLKRLRGWAERIRTRKRRIAVLAIAWRSAGALRQPGQLTARENSRATSTSCQNDVCEFESSHPSHAVQSPRCDFWAWKNRRHSGGTVLYLNHSGGRQ